MASTLIHMPHSTIQNVNGNTGRSTKTRCASPIPRFSLSSHCQVGYFFSMFGAGSQIPIYTLRYLIFDIICALNAKSRMELLILGSSELQTQTAGIAHGIPRGTRGIPRTIGYSRMNPVADATIPWSQTDNPSVPGSSNASQKQDKKYMEFPFKCIPMLSSYKRIGRKSFQGSDYRTLLRLSGIQFCEIVWTSNASR